ncbi:Protein of unknown function [Anaerobranca californiensis DSM 14826]|jgi:uncharacterized membrane protein|uniref:Heat induced stress protein YflT n=1 Tax=Anaerobranca californiensis DSM 14826 TaxID=1120989 RepID=A0A1M6KDM8_9FIRM|nr:DUF1269 domain-containing protein [Anaerobranca californiensis]SHJ57018.1 Protein of unknown function [Anaerobranca californiensis DSM 14826]
MDKKIIAFFNDNYSAEKAVKELRERGIKGEISILAKHKVKDQQNGEGENNSNYPVELSYEKQNLADGTIIGGTLGGLSGLALGAGLFIIPGAGPIIAAGPLAGILTGTLTGGVAGGLIDYGIPEEHSKYYEQQLHAGNFITIINCSEKDKDNVIKILRENNAKEVKEH